MSSKPSLFQQVDPQLVLLEKAVKYSAEILETFQRIARNQPKKQQRVAEDGGPKGTADLYAKVIESGSDSTAIESSINAAFSVLGPVALKNLETRLLLQHQRLQKTLKQYQLKLNQKESSIQFLKDKDAYVKTPTI